MNERDAFEEQFFKPPFLARMLERAGLYTDGLDDKDAFLALTFDAFWNLRERIKCADDVTHVFGEALTQAARTRPRWLVHYGAALELTKWVRGNKLGRES